MVVVARHRGRFVADDGLDDVKGDARVRREGHEGVSERVECRFGREVLAAFEVDGRDDVCCLEDAREFLADEPASAMVHFTDRRQDGTGEGFGIEDWGLGFEKRRSECLVNRNGDRAAVGVAARLRGDELDDSLFDVDARPIEATAIPKPQASIDSD